jgi:hypothetical protein
MNVKITGLGITIFLGVASLYAMETANKTIINWDVEREQIFKEWQNATIAANQIFGPREPLKSRGRRG